MGTPTRVHSRWWMTHGSVVSCVLFESLLDSDFSLHRLERQVCQSPANHCLIRHWRAAWWKAGAKWRAAGRNRLRRCNDKRTLGRVGSLTGVRCLFIGHARAEPGNATRRKSQALKWDATPFTWRKTDIDVCNGAHMAESDGKMIPMRPHASVPWAGVHLVATLKPARVRRNGYARMPRGNSGRLL